MPSYEQIRLIGGPCDGEIHMWDGGDYFQVAERPSVGITARHDVATDRDYAITRHTYRRNRDSQGNRTSNFIYQGTPEPKTIKFVGGPWDGRIREWIDQDYIDVFINCGTGSRVPKGYRYVREPAANGERSDRFVYLGG